MSETKEMAERKGSPVVIVKSHTVSREGAKLRVTRIELSKIGTALLTSTSTSIPDLEVVVPEPPVQEQMRARG
jgi:hypothetical protein